MHRFQAFLVNEQAAVEQNFWGRKGTPARMPQGRVLAHCGNGLGLSQKHRVPVRQNPDSTGIDDDAWGLSFQQDLVT
jgi:hypothetical protein